MSKKITISWMFEHLTPLCKSVYEGKEVVFIVPQEFANSPICEFLNSNPDAILIDQTKQSQNYENQRSFVSRLISKRYSANKIIVLTYSPVVLSDAFACQVYIWREEKFRTISMGTFGAEPGRIALAAFSVPEVIGSVSDNFLQKWLEKDWKKEDLPELKSICNEIGGGWPRAKIREIIDIFESMEKN